MSKTNKQFTSKEKAIVIWGIIVLGQNSTNLIADKLIELIHVITSSDQMESFLRIWKIYMNVWYDILILSNGITLLSLYRYFAKV